MNAGIGDSMISILVAHVGGGEVSMAICVRVRAAMIVPRTSGVPSVGDDVISGVLGSIAGVTASFSCDDEQAPRKRDAKTTATRTILLDIKRSPCTYDTPLLGIPDYSTRYTGPMLVQFPELGIGTTKFR
jgi:hypothetical protein